MIIDAHAHIGKMRRYSRTQSEATVLASMEKYGIAYSLVSSGDGEEFSAKSRFLRSHLRQLDLAKATVAFAKRHPTRIGALLWCRPNSDRVDAAFDDFIHKNRKWIYGLKFHPFCSIVDATDPRMEPYYDLARKYDLPLLFHTAVDRCSSILLLEKAAQTHPDLTFIAAHMELLSDNLEAIRVVKDNPNIYGDTAWVIPTKALLAIQTFGPDKLMFGTDNPIDGLDTLNHRYYKTYRGKYFQRKLGKTSYDKLMSGNAIKIYRLPVNIK